MEVTRRGGVGWAGGEWSDLTVDLTTSSQWKCWGGGGDCTTSGGRSFQLLCERRTCCFCIPFGSYNRKLHVVVAFSFVSILSLVPGQDSSHMPVQWLFCRLGFGMGCSSVGRASDCQAADAGLIPRCGKGFSSWSQLSVKALFRCPYNPSMRSHALTSVRALKILWSMSQLSGLWQHKHTQRAP